MSDKSVGEVKSPCGGEVEKVGVRYGFAGGGRACFSPAAESSNGVVKHSWVGGFAFVAATISCDGVNERVFMVKNKS